MSRNNAKGGLETVFDLLFAGDTRRVDVINTRADLVGVTILLEGVQQLHIALRELDGNHISIEALNRRENIPEVGVAKVGMSLSLIFDTRCRQFEGVHSPLQVFIPVTTTKRQLIWISDNSGNYLASQLTPSRMAGSST